MDLMKGRVSVVTGGSSGIDERPRLSSPSRARPSGSSRYPDQSSPTSRLRAEPRAHAPRRMPRMSAARRPSLKRSTTSSRNSVLSMPSTTARHIDRRADYRHDGSAVEATGRHQSQRELLRCKGSRATHGSAAVAQS